ncbi:hypothetical protein [Thermogemmatispora carboxidivorans]|nr:hypothetical protein [Thermogemmatispora carboxidivorans]
MLAAEQMASLAHKLADGPGIVPARLTGMAEKSFDFLTKDSAE